VDPATRACARPNAQLLLPGSASGEMQMTAMDLVGLLLLVFLIAPMVTAGPSRY